jgi:hypothetical protein
MEQVKVRTRIVRLRTHTARYLDGARVRDANPVSSPSVTTTRSQSLARGSRAARDGRAQGATDRSVSNLQADQVQHLRVRQAVIVGVAGAGQVRSVKRRAVALRRVSIENGRRGEMVVAQGRRHVSRIWGQLFVNRKQPQGSFIGKSTH